MSTLTKTCSSLPIADQLKLEMFFVLACLITNIHFVYSINHFLPASDCNYCIAASCKGTVTASADFNATRDRLSIESDIRGWGFAEDILIHLLSTRSDEQKVLIAEDYIKTGKTLMDVILSDNRRKSQQVLLALATPLPIFYADELNIALQTKNYKTIIEIMTSLPGCAIREVSVIYQLKYSVSLQTEISKRTWFKFRSLMLELAKGDRENHELVNVVQARQDAKVLVNSGVLAWKDKTMPFIDVLTKRSYPQLRATFDIYETIKREKKPNFKSILNDVNNIFSDKIRETFLAIIRNVLNQSRFFAAELESAFSSYPKTDESRKVIRIIRGRCELDLKDIKKEYAAVYKKPLEDQIKTNTKKHLHKQLTAVVHT